MRIYDWTLLEVVRVVDADTLDLRIGRGFGDTSTMRFRLKGVDAPEIYGRNASEEGQQALSFVTSWLTSKMGSPLVVRTFRGSSKTVGMGDGAFGRWLCDVIDTNNGESLVEGLLNFLGDTT